MVPSRAANILPVNGSTLHPNLAASLSNAVGGQPTSRPPRSRQRHRRHAKRPRRRGIRLPSRATQSLRPRITTAPRRYDERAKYTPSARRRGSVRIRLGRRSRPRSMRPPGVCSSSGHRFAATADPQGNVAVKNIASSAVSLLCISTAAWKSATAASRSAASRSRAWDRNRTATNVSGQRPHRERHEPPQRIGVFAMVG